MRFSRHLALIEDLLEAEQPTAHQNENIEWHWDKKADARKTDPIWTISLWANICRRGMAIEH
jgi:hypothetical protein